MHIYQHPKPHYAGMESKHIPEHPLHQLRSCEIQKSTCTGASHNHARRDPSLICYSAVIEHGPRFEPCRDTLPRTISSTAPVHLPWLWLAHRLESGWASPTHGSSSQATTMRLFPRLTPTMQSYTYTVSYHTVPAADSPVTPPPDSKTILSNATRPPLGMHQCKPRDH